MAPLPDVEKDDELFYLLRVPSLPFGPYDRDSFPYNVLSTLYRHWFGKNMNNIETYNDEHTSLNLDFCASYHVIKGDLMDFFKAGRESWIKDKFDSIDGFNLLSNVIKEREKTATAKRNSKLSRLKDHEIRISTLETQNMNLTTIIRRLKALNQKWKNIALLLQNLDRVKAGEKRIMHKKQ